jgi:hypothetical protein
MNPYGVPYPYSPAFSASHGPMILNALPSSLGLTAGAPAAHQAFPVDASGFRYKSYYTYGNSDPSNPAYGSQAALFLPPLVSAYPMVDFSQNLVKNGGATGGLGASKSINKGSATERGPERSKFAVGKPQLATQRGGKQPEPPGRNLANKKWNKRFKKEETAIERELEQLDNLLAQQRLKQEKAPSPPSAPPLPPPPPPPAAPAVATEDQAKAGERTKAGERVKVGGAAKAPAAGEKAKAVPQKLPVLKGAEKEKVGKRAGPR